MATIIEDSRLFHGGAGDDDILVIVSGVAASGEKGDDTLTTSLFGFGTNLAFFSTELRGDSGNDSLRVSMGLDGNIDGKAFSQLYGGDGADNLWVDTTTRSSEQEIRAFGGGGDDTLHITSNLPTGTKHGHYESIYAYGDDGDDEITVTVNKAAHGGRGDSGDVAIWGGNGDDRIYASNTSVSDNASVVIGDYGSDGGDNDISTVMYTQRGWASSTVSIGSPFPENGIFGKQGDNRIDIETTTRNGSALGLVRGGDGKDSILSEVTATSVHNSEAGQNNLSGKGGDDQISATLFLVGDSGTGLNQLSGDNGNDRLSAKIFISQPGAFEAHSILLGGTGRDRLSATGGMENVLDGGTGADTLRGGAGTDRLIGGAGIDSLTGRGGEDVFVFAAAGGGRDRITDFSRGEDRIDLSDIDANAFRDGDQRFAFGGTEGTGRVWVEEDQRGLGSLVRADTGRAVLTISVLDEREADAHDYTGANFIL